MADDSPAGIILVIVLCLILILWWNFSKRDDTAQPGRHSRGDNAQPYRHSRGDYAQPRRQFESMVRAGSFNFNFGGIADAEDVVEINTAIPELDLHMRRCKEAKQLVKMFLDQARGHYRQVRIITGRGLNSPGGKPILQPEIRLFLESNGYSFREEAYGGCFLVNL